MTVVEAVLELLRVHLPDFAIDERWQRWRSPPRGGQPRQDREPAGTVPRRERPPASAEPRRKRSPASAETRREPPPPASGKQGERSRPSTGQRRGSGQRGRRPDPREDRRAGAAARTRVPTLAACYAALGVARGADLRTVRRAWVRLVRKHHPDLCGGDAERQRQGTELVKQLNFAYEEIRKHLHEQSS